MKGQFKNVKLSDQNGRVKCSANNCNVPVPTYNMLCDSCLRKSKYQDPKQAKQDLEKKFLKKDTSEYNSHISHLFSR